MPPTTSCGPAEPNRFVAEIIGPLTPGHAVDLAAGEGRNAIWMVEQGWTVVASDYSSVAVDRMRSLAADRLGDDASRLTPVVADATQPAPGGPAAYDLALLCYLQLPADEWRQALRAAVEAVRPGGRVVVIGHAGRNLAEGWGGPSEPGRALRPRGGARPCRRPARHRPAVGHPGAPGRDGRR